MASFRSYIACGLLLMTFLGTAVTSLGNESTDDRMANSRRIRLDLQIGESLSIKGYELITGDGPDMDFFKNGVKVGTFRGPLYALAVPNSATFSLGSPQPYNNIYKTSQGKVFAVIGHQLIVADSAGNFKVRELPDFKQLVPYAAEPGTYYFSMISEKRAVISFRGPKQSEVGTYLLQHGRLYFFDVALDSMIIKNEHDLENLVFDGMELVLSDKHSVRARTFSPIGERESISSESPLESHEQPTNTLHRSNGGGYTIKDPKTGEVIFQDKSLNQPLMSAISSRYVALAYDERHVGIYVRGTSELILVKEVPLGEIIQSLLFTGASFSIETNIGKRIYSPIDFKYRFTQAKPVFDRPSCRDLFR